MSEERCWLGYMEMAVINLVSLAALVNSEMSTYESSNFLSFQKHIIYDTGIYINRKLA